MSTAITSDLAGELFRALADQLSEAGESFEIVVVGGSAFIALGLVERPATKDVDVVALYEAGVLVDPRPLPPSLLEARDRVAREFGVWEGWLNAGPASLLDFGLPDGFVERLTPVRYGESLVVHLASRRDQIHLKLYAYADQGAGRHEADLRALGPTRDELVVAARWTRTHDPSEGFLLMLTNALARLGVEDARLDT